MPNSKDFKDVSEISNERSSTVIQDICTTVDSSHAQDIYNRDITPDTQAASGRTTPNIRLIKQDHHYQDSPKTLQTKYKIMKHKYDTGPSQSSQTKNRSIKKNSCNFKGYRK